MEAEQPWILEWTDGCRHGCRMAQGPGGKAALRLANPAGGRARDYVTFSATSLEACDFTVLMWLKTINGGLNGWCSSAELLPWEEAPSSRDVPARGTKGGVLFSAGGPGPLRAGGFTLELLPPRAYLTVSFQASGAREPIVLTHIRAACDDRWHQLAVTVGRRDWMRVYVDGEAAAQADVSGQEGLPLPSGLLTLGADEWGERGFGEGDVEGFSLRQGALSESEVAQGYYIGAVRVLAKEILDRRLEGSPLYDREKAAALNERARRAGNESPNARNPKSFYLSLREEYEAFLLSTRVKPDLRFMLVSDIHCEGNGGPRAKALESALDWARELHMDAVADGGDYSNYGKDFELDSYWQAMDRHWPGKPLFVTVGNHETLELKCHELVSYHNGHLARRGMVPKDWNKLYYEGEAAGYHFLVLAQYSDTYTVTGYNRMWAHAGEIKKEQIDWLRARLEKYSGRGKPVFLIIHNAIREVLDRQTQGNFREDFVVLKENGLYDTLKDYPDVVVFTGHVHHGLGTACGLNATAEGYQVIDVPSFRTSAYGYGAQGRDPAGDRHAGYFVYVYGNTIQLRAADLASRRWLTAYDQTAAAGGETRSGASRK